MVHTLTPTAAIALPLPLQLPADLKLQVTPEQFEALAAVNDVLRLERTAQGELLVNPPTGWETGERNFSINGELFRWYERGAVRRRDDPGVGGRSDASSGAASRREERELAGATAKSTGSRSHITKPKKSR